MADPTLDRESEPVQGPTQADLRADYDDEFGRVRTPRQIARRRLLIPAIDFMILGVLGLMYSLGAAIYVLYDYIGDAADPMEYLEMVGLLTLCGLGGALSTLIVVAADGMLRLRNHRVALIASYVVTSLSLGTIYAILFYPFGIWALVLLYKTEVRNEFDRVPEPAEPKVDDRQVAGGRRSRRGNRPILLLAIGAFGILFMLVICVFMIRSVNSTNHWDDEDVWGPIAFTLIGTLGFTLALLRGIQLYRRYPSPPKSVRHDAVPRHPEPE